MVALDRRIYHLLCSEHVTSGQSDADLSQDLDDSSDGQRYESDSMCRISVIVFIILQINLDLCVTNCVTFSSILS